MNRLFLAAAALSLASAAHAVDYHNAMQDYVAAHVAPWASDPVLVEAVKAQNAANAGLAQADIDSLDATWRAEVGTASTPTITPVVNNPVSDFLRAHQAESGGAITEVFVMDDHGMLVASSGITSDYWQGDEEKWSMTYPKGPGAMHSSEVEFDESSQTYQGQISITIVDPASGQAVGAMTIGLDAESLM